MSAYLAEGAIVRGDVTLGQDVSIWYNAVLRCEFGSIVIGNRTNIQDCCVFHTSDQFPVVVGDEVTVGHGAIIHGCTIGSQTLVGMGSIIMNGAVIGNRCMVGAGALVTQGTVVPDESLVLGSPAKVVRKLTAEEIAWNKTAAASYVAGAQETLPEYSKETLDEGMPKK